MQGIVNGFRVLHQIQFFRDDTIFLVGAVELPEASFINEHESDFKDLKTEDIDSKKELISLNLKKKFELLYQNKKSKIKKVKVAIIFLDRMPKGTNSKDIKEL